MHIDRTKVKNVFNNYVDNYNSHDGKIKLKIYHTYKVSEICEKIAKSLKFNNEDIDLAYLLGILHDIGRFEQVRRYGTFNDAKSINHAKLGTEILFDEGKIRDFIDDESEDELIKSAILYHNMYEIPKTSSKRIELFSKLLRDADKIDIFRVNVQDPPIDVYGSSKDEIINSRITNEVLESFKRLETVPRVYKKTAVDNVVCHIAYVFGIYFKESIKIIINEGYFQKLIEFKSNDDITNKQFDEIRKVIDLYIKKKLHN
ncbi:HD domain-containing protein [Clostridium sp. HCP1S3_B4]|uniref:HD domain-containing protein n=1 Tax=unclassified Clostridium TaxID=2614128 RepID=UPI003F8C06BF